MIAKALEEAHRILKPDLIACIAFRSNVLTLMPFLFDYPSDIS